MGKFNKDASAGALTGQSNIVTNGNFTQWDDVNHPTGWLVPAPTGSNYIERNRNAVRLVSDGTFVYCWQTKTTVGKTYIVEFDILDITAGTLLYSDSGCSTVFSTVGHHICIYTATANTAGLKRNAATDVTFANFTIQEYKGKVTGRANLVTDGNMEAVGTTAWNATGGATISKDTTDPHRGSQAMKAVNVGGGAGGVRQENLIVAGNKYRVTGWARGDGGTGRPFIYFDTLIHWSGTTSTEWQHFDFTREAQNSTYVGIFNASSAVGDFIMIDDLRVEKIN